MQTDPGKESGHETESEPESKRKSMRRLSSPKSFIDMYSSSSPSPSPERNKKTTPRGKKNRGMKKMGLQALETEFRKEYYINYRATRTPEQKETIKEQTRIRNKRYRERKRLQAQKEKENPALRLRKHAEEYKFKQGETRERWKRAQRKRRANVPDDVKEKEKARKKLCYQQTRAKMKFHKIPQEPAMFAQEIVNHMKKDE
jgi:hypothetical protein